MSRRTEYVETQDLAVEQRGRLEDDTAAIALASEGLVLVVDGDPFELLGAVAFAIMRGEGVEPGTREMALLRARLAVAVGGYETGADAAAGLRDLLTDAMHALSSASQDAPELLSVVDQVDVARNVFEEEDAEWTEGA